MKLYEFFLKIAVPGIVFIVTIFLFNIVNALTYTANPDYTEYYTFTKIRSQILDYTWCDYENLRDELTAIGVSENDYQMILHWDFADQAVFSTEKMQQVLDIINAHRVNLHPSISRSAQHDSVAPTLLSDDALLCAARIILRHYKSQKILGTGGVGTDGAWISGLFLQTWTVGLSPVEFGFCSAPPY